MSRNESKSQIGISNYNILVISRFTLSNEYKKKLNDLKFHMPIIKMHMFEKLFATRLSSRDATLLEDIGFTFISSQETP